MSAAFDVVIVGAGPAGCVLANRLSADPNRRVALVDAGPDYGPDPSNWPPEMLDPNGVPTESHSWGYSQSGRPQDNQLALPRAKVFGGTTTVNGCIWMRGSALDYDEWAALGNPGWSFNEMALYIALAETDPIGGDFHGSGGPVLVGRSDPAINSPIDRRLIKAADSIGVPFISDHNGDPVQQIGIGPTPKNVANGIRMNAAFTYLNPVRNRANLTLLPEREIDRVTLEGGRATGVLTTSGELISATEVILCAGAYGSPAILMRSGIGPAGHLAEHGIAVQRDLPGVGQNLHDHPLVNGLMECAIAPGNEPDSPVFMAQMIKARSSQVDDEIDLHVYQGQSFDTSSSAWSYWLSVSLQYARSTGQVRLTSSDPATPLEIDHAFFSDPRDLEALCDGVEFVNRLVRDTELGEIVEPIEAKSLTYADRDELRAKVQHQVGTTFHPSSTCKMGPTSDPLAVVDNQGRVHGVRDLRVVDASIFPSGPRGNLHVPVIAAAERISGWIIESSPSGAVTQSRPAIDENPRSRFSPEDWRLIAGLPANAATAAAIADGVSLFGTIREMHEGVTAMNDGATTYSTNRLVVSILEEMASLDNAVETGTIESESADVGGQDPAGFVHEVIANADRVRVALDRASDSADRDGYIDWVLNIVERVINRSRSGGFLGIGSHKVSQDESEFRDNLEAALRP